MSHVNFTNNYGADMLVVGWIGKDIELTGVINPTETLKIKNPEQYTKIELITPQMLSSAPGLKTKNYGVDEVDQDSDLKYVINYNFEKGFASPLEGTYMAGPGPKPPVIVVGDPGVPPQ